MPLTLTLSPRAGRGTCPKQRSRLRKAVRHIPFAPQARRRCRQADEGLRPHSNFEECEDRNRSWQ
ncbi:hypothetical protein GFL49_03490 [Rhizobium leguminosarum bv. viciae]|nr:hypothetical protein [Rhizobium leguminosarum bv. viciae]